MQGVAKLYGIEMMDWSLGLAASLKQMIFNTWLGLCKAEKSCLSIPTSTTLKAYGSVVLSLMSEGSLHPWKCCRAMELPLERGAEILQMLNTHISLWWQDILLQLVWGTKRDLGSSSQEKERENRVWRPLNHFLSVWCVTVSDLLCLNWGRR